MHRAVPGTHERGAAERARRKGGGGGTVGVGGRPGAAGLTGLPVGGYGRRNPPRETTRESVNSSYLYRKCPRTGSRHRLAEAPGPSDHADSRSLRPWKTRKG